MERYTGRSLHTFWSATHLVLSSSTWHILSSIALTHKLIRIYTDTAHKTDVLWIPRRAVLPTIPPIHVQFSFTLLHRARQWERWPRWKGYLMLMWWCDPGCGVVGCFVVRCAFWRTYTKRVLLALWLKSRRFFVCVVILSYKKARTYQGVRWTGIRGDNKMKRFVVRLHRRLAE